MDVDSDSSALVLDQHQHVAHVRYIEGDNHLRLQLRIRNDRKTFFRPVAEKCDKLRYRLQILAAAVASDSAGQSGGLADCSTSALGHTKSKKVRAKAKKKKKAAKQSDATENDSLNTLDDSMEALTCGEFQYEPAQAKVSVRFFNGEGLEFFSKNSAIGDVLMQTARIEIGDAKYVVLKNQPLVLKLSVLEPVLAGIPVVPIPETEFCHPDECSWKWFRIVADGQEVLCGETRRYIPSNDETGCSFRVECHAPSMHSVYADDSKAELFTTPVIQGPNREVFKKRQQLGMTRAYNTDGEGLGAFRVVCYNILFDGYTATDHAQQNLFSYASASIMNEMYRMQLVFQEIEESNADIVCLQEMGEAAYNTFFAPMMKPIGFHTFYSGKMGSTREGCAVFVRRDAFEVIEERMVDLGVTIKQSPDPTIKALLAEFPEIAKGFAKIPSVAQLLLLRSTRGPTRHLVLSNTHLFYREDAHLIRLLQTVAVVREVSKIRLDLGGHVGLLLCGDYNAFPTTAPVHFLLNGSIDSSHREWQEAPQFKWNRTVSKNGNENSKDHPNNHRVERGRFEHHLALESACGIPAFTNFAGTFVGVLDYIMMGCECLTVKQVFPFFTAEEVSEEVALPSSKFPSDHISLICDLDWKS